MTSPDPAPGTGPAPDDATSPYDAEAARAAAAGREPADPADAAGREPEDPADPAAPPAPGETPWPVSDDAPWPTPPVASLPPAAAAAPAAPAQVPPAPGAGGWGTTGTPASTGWSAPSGPTPGATPPADVAPNWSAAGSGSWNASGSGPAPAGLPPAGLPPTAAKGSPPGLVAGIILVVIGGVLLLTRVVDISLGGVTWPLWIVVPGIAMLVGSFFIPPKGGVGLAIPGAIVTIVGLVLWVQDVYGLYATWAYAWALVAPTGPGVGMLLYGLVHRDSELIGDGFRTMLVGLGLFLGFALFFEGVIGLSGAPIANLDEVLPYAIIGLGILLVILSFFGGGRRRENSPRPR